MKKRPHISINVERKLWAQSGGYCMNPKCNAPLSDDNSRTSVGEMAHIEPHSEGGDVSVDNLILLCRNCHRLNEPLDRPEIKDELRQWKLDRKEMLERTFAVQYQTFDQLSAVVEPLLRKNKRIFDRYGPHTNNPEAFKWWEASEKKILVNNAKLKMLFEKNLKFFPNPNYDGSSESEDIANNYESIQEFIAHVDEFEMTRDGYDGVRIVLFPNQVLSIFGIEESTEYTAVKYIFAKEYSVAKIQNLIGKLKAKDYKVTLNLLGDSTLTIDRNGDIEKLDLEDNPRVENLLHVEDADTPITTELPMEELKFFFKYVHNTGCEPKFADITDLTTLTVNDQYIVKVLYSYLVTEHEVQSLNLQDVTHIVNLDYYAKGFTEGAKESIDDADVKIMGNREFLRFCHGLRKKRRS